MNDGKYSEYLRSYEWRQIAAKRMKIDSYRCVGCGCEGTSKNPLEVHHLSYKKIYVEKNRVYEDLVTLCRFCHLHIHRIMERQTSPDGRHGWQDRDDIPKVHAFNINGTIEYAQERKVKNGNDAEKE